MSTAAISSSSIHQDLQSYFQARNSDLRKLGQALQSGDLATAQQEYQAIQDLGQSGPFANGVAFKMSGRERAFDAIGQALQSGDLATAQQVFGHLMSSFRRDHMQPPPVSAPVLGGPTTPVVSSTGQPVAGSSSTAGPEVILNLGNMTPGEQITIGVNNTGAGMEQLSISVAQSGQKPEQITLNLNQNSNQQIILNLFNSTTGTQNGSGVNLSA